MTNQLRIDNLRRVAVLDANPFSHADQRISIVVVGKSLVPDVQRYFVLGAWTAKLAPPDMACGKLIQMVDAYQVDVVAMMETTESVFAPLIANRFGRFDNRFAIRALPRVLPPAARIAAFQPVFNSGAICIADTVGDDFWAAFRDYPDTTCVGYVVALADAIAALGAFHAPSADVQHGAKRESKKQLQNL